MSCASMLIVCHHSCFELVCAQDTLFTRCAELVKLTLQLSHKNTLSQDASDLLLAGLKYEFVYNIVDLRSSYYSQHTFNHHVGSALFPSWLTTRIAVLSGRLCRFSVFVWCISDLFRRSTVNEICIICRGHVARWRMCVCADSTTYAFMITNTIALD